ncbi:hypothetical protein OG539_43015 [Actinacidiphila glaucinigra]|uniref:hypothetical protein n=1 Tax=Actinacidiphila glaucinigra TaxID=235986 RepID=UPI003247C558
MTVHAEGAGSIAVGGDAINSIFVTGGVNQFFVGQYQRLAEAYLNTRSLYRELALEHFTGRAWLVRAVDDFLAANDRGYLLIEAEAGMGKTAFLAWVARERSYVHHFVRLMPDVNDVGVALRNLSAQLIRAWDLDTMAVGGVLPTSASRPDFFTEVLFEAADKRDATRPGEPIVIAVDGLNETAALPYQNPLSLPADLPVGVYVLATQRTTHIPLVVTTPRRVVRIRPADADNQADIRTYLEREVRRPGLAERVTDPASVADRLVSWCGGVWLVLRYVLAELRSGTRSPDELSTLPIGLWHYYARFWRGWQQAHESTWTAVDLPLLVTITAAREPLTLDLLCAMSRCPDPSRAADLVGDEWRPFLQITGEGAGEQYTAFHDSLSEFIAGQVDGTALTSAERFFVERLNSAQREAHQRIAERYLAAWGDLPHGLPRLRGEAAALDGGYGLRHLVAHLVHASQDAVLHSLMALEWPRDDHAEEPANAWYEAHRTRREFAGYALDVQRAWGQAERAPTMPRSLALELRYAMIAASVDSVAGNVPSELLALLIEHEIITAPQALELTREMSDARVRAESLSVLLPKLHGNLRAEAISEALASVHLVPDGYWRVGELLRLAEVAGVEHMVDLRRIADSLGREYERDIAKAGLDALGRAGPVAHVTTADPHEPRDPVEFLEQYRRRTSRGRATLMLGLPPGQGVEGSRYVRPPRWRAELLTETARTTPLREPVLRAALDTSLLVGDQEALTATLGAIVAELAATGSVPTALACALEIQDTETRARALFATAAHADVVDQALHATASIQEAATRGSLLRAHAARLAPLASAGSLAPVLADLPRDWHAAVLGATAAHVPSAQRESLLAEALEIAVSALDAGGARVLADLLVDLPASLIPSARAAVTAIADLETRDYLTAALAARLAHLNHPDEARALLAAIHDPYWRMTGTLRTATGLAASGQCDQAEALAATLPSPHWRAEIFARSDNLAAAYAEAAALTEPGARVAALLRIESVISSILESAHVAHHDRAERTTALLEIGPAATGHLEKGRGTLAETADPHGRAAAVPKLQAAQREGLERARATLHEITDAQVSAHATMAVAFVFGQRGRTAEALELIATLPEENRAAALVQLTPLPDDAVARAVAQAQALSDPVGRGRALARMTGPLVTAGGFDVLDHVRTVVRLLATGNRAQLLEAVPSLLPGLLELAGPEGLVDLAAAVSAAYRWWP